MLNHPMRILLVSDHNYPASGSHGAGRHVRAFPSGSGQHIHDLAARGLAALGHEVFYLLEGISEPLPPGITFASDVIPPVDIIHASNERVLPARMTQGTPWLASCHRHFTTNAIDLKDPAPKKIGSLSRGHKPKDMAAVVLFIMELIQQIMSIRKQKMTISYSCRI